MTRQRHLSAAGLVLLLAGPVLAQKIYFTDAGGPQSLIHRSNLDGTNVENLVTSGLANPFAIALDVGAGKMYWTDFDGMNLKRSNLDGSDIQTLGTMLMHAAGIGLDLSAGKVYWQNRPKSAVRISTAPSKKWSSPTSDSCTEWCWTWTPARSLLDRYGHEQDPACRPERQRGRGSGRRLDGIEVPFGLAGYFFRMDVLDGVVLWQGSAQ